VHEDGRVQRLTRVEARELTARERAHFVVDDAEQRIATGCVTLAPRLQRRA
jgi:hypothetical protein